MNVEFRFQLKPPDSAVGLGARVLLEDISWALIKILLIVVNLNKATYVLGF